MFEAPSHNISLTQENFGINPIQLTEQSIDITAPEGQLVKLQTATWKRKKEPTAIKNEVSIPLAYQQNNQAVFISGFGTRSQDWPVAFEGLGSYYDTVVGIDHPDAPTSTIIPHDKPLNNENFHNSGFVVLRAIEAKIKDGTLKDGVTAVGLSTGAPVLLEATAQDERESAETGRPRYITSLLLTAPAGMLDRPSFNEIAVGAGSAMGPYLKKNYVRDSYFQKFGKYKNTTSENIKPKTKTTFSELCQRIKSAWNKPEWKDIRSMHIGFELFEYAAQRLPTDEFMAFFHRVWPNQNPHFLPMTPSIKRNQELVYRNVTEQACTAIRDTDVRIELYEHDKAVPPNEFLTDKDRNEIAQVRLNGADMTALKQLNDRRMNANPSNKPYNEKWMLENKQQELLLDRIIQRVKQLFPNNINNTHVSINIGGNHLTPKADIDLIADLTVRRVDAEHQQHSMS